MAEQEQQNPSPISQSIQVGRSGLNLDATTSQVQQGELTFAMSAVIEGSDGNKVTYQNELGNEICSYLPTGYNVVGAKGILEKNLIFFLLANPTTGMSEIGTLDVNACKYTTFANAACLGFDINVPIFSIVVKETNCGTEVYWTQPGQPPRYVNLSNPPYTTVTDGCTTTVESSIDCNKMNIFPNFTIPYINVTSVDGDGENDAGTYQFAVQYANALTEPYTAFYNPTNPIPLFDPLKVTQDFNYKVGKSISLEIKGIDITGFYDYINVAVIKTVNNITSVQLVGTYQITQTTHTISYTGQSLKNLTIDDIFEKYNVYTEAGDITSSQDILILSDLVSQERASFQEIANNITLHWQTFRLPKDAYVDADIAGTMRGYMRDEIYPFEFVPILKNGYQCDGFTIPGRIANTNDTTIVHNADNTYTTPQPKWKVYNTASVVNYSPEYLASTTPATYTGPYQYGLFAYTESTETYPCNQSIYGSLSGKPIRHHRFPDSNTTHIHDSAGYIYPIGVKIDVQQIYAAIQASSLSPALKAQVVGFKIARGNRSNNKSVIAKGLINNVGKYTSTYNGTTYYFPNYLYNDVTGNDQFITGTTFDTDSTKRYTFHSPDTSFFQPFLGNVLKLETAEYGTSTGHYVQVQKHSKYKLYNNNLYLTAAAAGTAIAVMSGEYGFSDRPFDGVAAMTTYQTLTDIFQKITPRINYAYQLNSIGEYTNFQVVPTGNKQTLVDIAEYITPGFQSVGDTYNINNFQRETSVYLRSLHSLPYTNTVNGVPVDTSKNAGSTNSGTGTLINSISSFYASVKKNIDNQYGQIYSYETIDTGLYVDLTNTTSLTTQYVWGGDIFINRFAYKSKLPFFIENRVGNVDESDIFYNELYNIGKVKYWFSFEQGSGNGFLGSMFGTPTVNLDNQKDDFIYKTGKMYIAAYAIPHFYTESEVNVDFRQAYNNKEGDFYPHVASGIPDDWLQEYNVPIIQDNTYYYNKTYSKQNKESSFTHLPDNYDFASCRTNFPFRAIFSEQQTDFVNYRRNNWLVYKPASYFDFPQAYGKMISIDGMEGRQVLVRFENKALIYNSMLTTASSLGQVYLGQSIFNKNVPPVDYVETDLGYLGTQNHFLLKTEFGTITTDAKRGQIFLLPQVTNTYTKPQVVEITSDKYKCQQWFTQNLSFYILQVFPNYPTDNPFNGIGLHGVYDAKYNRLILTKKDYLPINPAVTYNPTTYKFYLNGTEVFLSDTTCFANKCFTVSFDFDEMRWISFHPYIPDYYVGYSNWFYAGVKNELWRHQTNPTIFNNFFGNITPYIIEHPYYFEGKEELLQSVKNYSRVTQQLDYEEFIEQDDVFFNKCILRNRQQCSGILNLVPKPKNAPNTYLKYPIYNTDSKTITFTKVNSCYNINTFWSILKDNKQQIFKKTPASIFPDINQDNMNYSKMFYKKYPLMAKDLLIRYILDNTSSYRITSDFNLVQTQENFK